MRKAIGVATGVLLLLLCSVDASADAGGGSMSIPVTLADLAKAAGLTRADPSTLPLDIVRLAFASPDDASDAATGPRAAIRRALDAGGDSGDRLPLPLSPATWRARVFRSEVPGDRLAAAIFGQRAPALLYHGLLALDAPTLEWIELHPDALDVLLKHPGTTAAFARSIHVRGGSVVTPGDAADEVWQAIVGADPRDAPAFVGKLMAARAGRLAAFYDAVTHLDAAHQRFALGAAGDQNRIRGVRKLADAVMHESIAWRLEEYPFLRADTDLLLLFRRIELDAHGTPAGPSKQVWAGIFGENGDAGPVVDAAWLATAILKSGGAMARHRADTVLFRAAGPGVRRIGRSGGRDRRAAGLLALPGADADARGQRRSHGRGLRGGGARGCRPGRRRGRGHDFPGQPGDRRSRPRFGNADRRRRPTADRLAGGVGRGASGARRASRVAEG